MLCKKRLRQGLKQLGKAQKIYDSDAQVMNLVKYTGCCRYARNISLSPEESFAKRNKLLQIYQRKLAGAIKHQNMKNFGAAKHKHRKDSKD